MEKKRPADKKRWWVVSQHNEITVEESGERPSTQVGKGERFKTVRGPFASKDEATKVRDDVTGRTLRAQAGR